MNQNQNIEPTTQINKPEMSPVNKFFKWFFAILVCVPMCYLFSLMIIEKGLIGNTAFTTNWNGFLILLIIGIALCIFLFIGLIRMKIFAVLILSLISIQPCLSLIITISGLFLYFRPEFLVNELVSIGLPLLLVATNIYFWANRKYFN